MDRRAFLRTLGIAGIAATVDRKYFFAPTGGWDRRWQHFSVKFPKAGSYPCEIVLAEPVGFALIEVNGIACRVPVY